MNKTSSLTCDPIDDLVSKIESFYSINQYKSILDFATEDIDLRDDVSADRERLDLTLTPYLIEPLERAVIEPGKRKIVTCCMADQMGKTTLEIVSIIYNVTYAKKLQCMVAYPSLDLAVETSNTKFVPLFRRISQFQDDLNHPFAIRSDRLKLSNAVIYWQGGGTKIVSKSCKMTVADECALYQCPGNVNNLDELIKRTRSYQECLSLFVSTPTMQDNAFWSLFLSGSQGYYYLQCQGCGNHTIRSCDIHHLQFEKNYDESQKMYVPVLGTCRLICPVCGFEHVESSRKEMIQNGRYIHVFADRLETNASYQAGVLASLQSVHSWDAIAAKQLASGKTAQLEDYISWDNSYRGLPYHPRQSSAQVETALQSHVYKPEELRPEDIEAVYCIADTQDAFSVVGIFALTKSNNYYLLEVHRPQYLTLDITERDVVNKNNQLANKPPEVTVLDLINREYLGVRPIMCLIDWRGHRPEEVERFAQCQRNIAMYAGMSLKTESWKPSPTKPKMFLCDARRWQAETIFELYSQTNKQTNYLYLPESLSPADLQEIMAYQPDKEKRSGNMPENWSPGDQVHDLFDVCKMFFAALKISVKIFPSKYFKHVEANLLKQSYPQRPTPTQNPQNNASQNQPLTTRPTVMRRTLHKWR